MYENESDLLESQKRFYGMITNIDDNFGRLHQNVESLGILDNTIIIFTTDNGTSNGYKYSKKKMVGFNAGMRGTKTSEYDGGHRVLYNKMEKGGLFGGIATLDCQLMLICTNIAKFCKDSLQFNKKIDGTDLSKHIINKSEAERMLVTDTQRNLWPEKGSKSCVMYGIGDWLMGLNYITRSMILDRKNIINENKDIANEMQKFYDDWWEGASKNLNIHTLIYSKYYEYNNCSRCSVNSITAGINL